MSSAASGEDDIENAFGRLSLTSHHEELGTASPREENDTGDSQTRRPSLPDYYSSADVADSEAECSGFIYAR